MELDRIKQGRHPVHGALAQRLKIPLPFFVGLRPKYRLLFGKASATANILACRRSVSSTLSAAAHNGFRQDATVDLTLPFALCLGQVSLHYSMMEEMVFLIAIKIAHPPGIFD